MMGGHVSHIRIAEPPHRWDEILDAQLPIYIEQGCGDWDKLSQNLLIAGLSSRFQLWLTEKGKRQAVEIREQTLHPKPQAEIWLLSVFPTQTNRSKARPFSEHHLVLLRARGQNSELAGMLDVLGARVSCLPMLEFTEPDDLGPITRALENLSTYDSLLFTSRNGVSHFLDELITQGFDTRDLAHKTLVAIGPGTAAELRDRTLKADLVADKNVAEGLLECLKAEHPGGLEGKRFLLPRAQVARDYICKELQQLGASVDDVPVYKTVAPVVNASQLERLDDKSILVVTSSSTVKHWAAATEKRPRCICMGPVCSNTAQELGFPVLGTAPHHNLTGLVDFIGKALGDFE